MNETGQSGTIDCDVHLVVPSVDVLLPYLSDHWQAYIRETAFKGPVDSSYPRGAPIGGHPEPGTAGEAAPDLDELRDAVFDQSGTTTAILTCAYAIESVRNPFAAAALASAVNDWQIEQWLTRDQRLRGSVAVPIQDPDLARAEIDRVGDHPGFVQVCLPVHAEALYGTPRYFPVFEAAVRHRLVVAIQHGGNPGSPPTAAGWPSHFIEEYVGMSHVFQSQVISLVTGGVFDKFPEVGVTLLESGVSWLPSLMWRLDKEWKGLRREVPWVRRLPSEYIREHIRLTAWPFDAPPDGAQINEITDQMGSDKLLLYASDYPHDHGRERERAFWNAIPASLAAKIRSENAREFYRLDPAPVTAAP
jgi:predicted TIM-barrel fold metal-dependent hydrolase